MYDKVTVVHCARCLESCKDTQYIEINSASVYTKKIDSHTYCAI